MLFSLEKHEKHSLRSASLELIRTSILNIVFPRNFTKILLSESPHGLRVLVGPRLCVTMNGFAAQLNCVEQEGISSFEKLS